MSTYQPNTIFHLGEKSQIAPGPWIYSLVVLYKQAPHSHAHDLRWLSIVLSPQISFSRAPSPWVVSHFVWNCNLNALHGPWPGLLPIFAYCWGKGTSGAFAFILPLAPHKYSPCSFPPFRDILPEPAPSLPCSLSYFLIGVNNLWNVSWSFAVYLCIIPS